MQWREFASAGAHANLSFGAAGSGRGEVTRCSAVIRVELPADGHLRLRADAALRGPTAPLSVQLRLLLDDAASTGCSAQATPLARPPAAGWTCPAPACLGIRRSSDPEAAARFVPLCSLGSLSRGTWSKLVTRASLFLPPPAAAHARHGAAPASGLDEIVFLAGAAPVRFFVDDVMVMSAAPPPPTLAFPPPLPPPEPAPARPPGWCDYLSSEYGREHPTGGAEAPELKEALQRRGRRARPAARLCHMDGDHLRGRWARNCAPSLIRRPEVYAYGAPVGRSIGKYEFRLCSRVSASERARAREALSWAWAPRHCRLRPVDGAEFGRWLAGRVLLVWGDSLSAQAYFSMLFMLGTEVEDVRDLSPQELDGFLAGDGAAEGGRMAGSGAAVPGEGKGGTARHEGSGAVGSVGGAEGEAPGGARRPVDLCSYGGVGEEGGAVTAARLRSGGFLIKVLGHAPLLEELGRPVFSRASRSKPGDILGAGRGGSGPTAGRGGGDDAAGGHGGGDGAGGGTDAAPAWWEGAVGAADILVFSVGHHYRALDSSFGSYAARAANALARLSAAAKPTASLILRTSNVGHPGCDAAAAPLPRGTAAWDVLGGWGWTPPAFQPVYFGQPRPETRDPYDWRAPPLHEGVWARAAAVGGLGHRFSVLNVSHLDARADGHVALAAAGHPDPVKAARGPDW